MNNPSAFWKNLKSGHFVSMVKEASQGQILSNSREVYNVMKPLFAENDDVESVYCIFLNAKNRILAIEKMFSGTISASAIYPRELVKRILALKSSAIVLTHNLCRALHKLCYVEFRFMLSKALFSPIIPSNSCFPQLSTSHNSKP